MTSTSAPATVREITVPATLDAVDAADFIAMARVRNEISAEILGNADDALTARELLAIHQPDPDELHRCWLIESDGEPIGRAGIDIPQEPGSRTAYWYVEILRAHQGRGIGSVGYDLIERTAREHGRTVLQAFASHPATAGEQLAPPTGFGAVPLDAAARFFRRHRHTLEQVERKSELDLAASVDTVGALFAAAERAAHGYRIVQWRVPTPAEHVAGYAAVKARMSTDVPAGALEYDAEIWDAARVARHDQRYLDAGQTVLVTAAQQAATGDLVAYNELMIGEEPTGPTHQHDTLVHRAHRGHRLGMLVKCAGLRTWHAEIAPHSPKVLTYNAEENRPMLDINEAIGFVPVSYEGAWKKVLS